MKRGLLNHNRINRAVTGILAVLLSAGMYGNSVAYDLNASHEEPFDAVITEEHELPVAMADGDFGGERSHSEQVENGTIEGTSDSFSFNIYEIVPEYGMALFGYMIGGCEPIAPSPSSDDINNKTEIEKCKARASAYMDAICNKNPGGSNDAEKMVLSIDDGTEKHYGIWYDRNVEGYYERVADGEGVYKYVKSQYTETGSGNNTVKTITSVEMKSKVNNEGGNYDFVWHYGAPDPSKKIITDPDYVGSMKKEDVIYLKNYKKNIYCNNESFLTIFYSGGKDKADSSGTINRLQAQTGTDGNGNPIIETVSGTYGAYNINQEDKRTVTGEHNNKRIVDAWKQKNGINVFVRTPGDLKDSDIENADLIIFSAGLKDKPDILKYYNRMNGGKERKFKKFSKNIDITWKQTLKIYEHAAVKKDVAVAMNMAMYREYLRNEDSNIARLLWLLYTAKDNSANSWYDGVRPEFFADMLWDNDQYVFPASSTSDSVRGYIRLSKDKVQYRTNTNGSWSEKKEWWKFSDPNPFNECFLLRNTSHDLAGTYGVSMDKEYFKGQDKNLILFESDTEMMKIGYTDSWFRDMLSNRVETTKHNETTSEPYYISMDILNGDSKGSGGIVNASNKVLYVNEYELPPISGARDVNRHYTDEIPVHFRIFSSHDIESVKVYKDAKVDPDTKEIKKAARGLTKSCIDTYVQSPVEGSGEKALSAILVDEENNVQKTVKVGGVDVTINVKRYEDAKPDVNGDLSVELNIDSSELIAGGKYKQNTSFVVEVTNTAGKSVADSIRVVKRNFFNLN